MSQSETIIEKLCFYMEKCLLMIMMMCNMTVD